jgi:hypothetical protein
MTPEERDLDPKYLKALIASDEHWLDAVNRTEESYREFPMYCDSCAVCAYQGYREILYSSEQDEFTCDGCFLDDRPHTCICAKEWNSVWMAKNLSNFHSAALALYGRIHAEVERVRKIQAKQKPAPKSQTTVTVWWMSKCAHQKTKGIVLKNDFDRDSYTFKGTPDIPRIMAETLEQGALAIKVECTESYQFEIYTSTSMYFWEKSLDLLHSYRYGLKYITSCAIADSDIEAAITSWIDREKKPPKPAFEVGDIVVWDKGPTSDLVILDEICHTQVIVKDKKGTLSNIAMKSIRPANPDQIDEFYTVDGMRAYEDQVGDITLETSTINQWLFIGQPTKARDLCAKAGIPIMAWGQTKKYYGGEFMAPKGEK